jgi:hypothetical protein
MPFPPCATEAQGPAPHSRIAPTREEAPSMNETELLATVHEATDRRAQDIIGVTR